MKNIPYEIKHFQKKYPELTFYSGGGFMEYYPKSVNNKLGAMFDLLHE